MAPQNRKPLDAVLTTGTQCFVSIDTSMDLPAIDSDTTETVSVIKKPHHLKRSDLAAGPDSTRHQIDGKEYRIDSAHEKFNAGELLAEPRIHVSVKSNLSDDRIDIEKLADHKNAIRISQGIEPIVVSQFDSIDLPKGFNLETVHPRSDNEFVVGPQPIVIETEPLRVEQPIASGLPVQLDEAASDESQEVEADLPPGLPDIKPAWEVKAFRWPETIERLCRNHKPAFQKLVESLNLNINRNNFRIGIIHSHAGQGSTTLATCMAKVLAETHAKVLLVDMDFENPQLEETANIKLKNGWQELSNPMDNIGEYLVREKSSDITVMPLGREIDLMVQRPELLRKVKDLAPSLTKQFDCSVFDIGNVSNLMIDEHCHVGFLDGVVIVSDSSGNESVAVSIYEQLVAAGVPSVVIAENFRNRSRSAA